MGFLTRAEWLLRKRWLQNNLEGFFAGIFTYASNDVSFSEYVRLYGNTRIIDTRVGRHTYFSGSQVGRATIGSFCSIGPGSRIGGMGTHPIHMISTHPAFFSTLRQSGDTFAAESHFDEFQPTCVGHDVWVGANAVVLDGVTIGNGAVIAAGAIVTEDVPAYTVVGGVPAKFIKLRFNADEIVKLQELQWWTYPSDVLKKVAPLFLARDVNQLAAAILCLKREH